MLDNNKKRISIKINSVVTLFLLVISLVLLSWLNYKNPVIYDWTASGRNTLSSTSIDLLEKMPEKIDVISYARNTPFLRSSIKKFIAKYQKYKPNISLSFVDPDTSPDEARNLGITVNGEILVRYKGRTEHLKTDNEQVFANTLRRLLNNQEKWIALVEGHNERSALSTANHDISGWVSNIIKQGYKVQPINLLEITAIPDNTKVLVIASPMTNYDNTEVNKIINYVDKGGNLLWLHEPNSSYNLDALTKKLPIEFMNGVIIDTVGREIGIQDPTITFVTKSLYAKHVITDGFDLVTLFPIAGAINILKSDTWSAKSILNTGKHTWNELGKLEGEVELNNDTEKQGPLVLGVSLERKINEQENNEPQKKQQRIIVVGDGDFLSNAYFLNNGNGELGIRIINWLSNNDDFISIPSRIVIDAHLKMPFYTLGIIGIFFLFLIPISMTAYGILINLRRKKQ